MDFIVFTKEKKDFRTRNSGSTIHINPAHVISFSQRGNGTSILLSNGAELRLSDSIIQVRGKLNGERVVTRPRA